MKTSFSRIDAPSRRVVGESALFAGSQSVRLLFPAERVERVYNLRNGELYQEGIDYAHVPGTDTLLRLPFSRMPHLSKEEMTPAKDAPGITCFPARGANAIPDLYSENGALIFDNNSRFAATQVLVDYTATAVEELQPQPQFPGRLPRVKELLKNKGAVKIVSLGDSITEGYNASNYTRIQPFQPPYAELVPMMLSEATGASVTCKNLGVDGSTSTHAVQVPQRWAGEKPELLTVAYGMNDFSKRNLTGYLSNLREIIRIAREARADTEILLIASMPGNPKWKCTPEGSAREFAAALREMVLGLDEHISMADQDALVEKLFERKGFYDLTGNGVNHPNDFLHVLLAENICNCILA